MQVINDIEMAMTLASVLPAAITFIDGELPSVEAQVKADYEGVATPAKAIVADVESVVKGGTVEVVTQNVEKTVTDLESLITAVQTLIGSVPGYAEGEWAKLYPVVQPLAAALKINLPTPTATATVATGTTATAPAAATVAGQATA